MGSSGVERLRVTADGNIGIGTTTPTTKLDVVGDIKASSSIISPFFFAQAKANFLAQSLSQGSYWTWNSSNGQGETNFVNVIYRDNFGGFTFSTKVPSFTTSSNSMRMKGYGNVVIGTDSPAEKLDVVGTIKTTDIKATNYNDTNGNKMLLQNCYWSGIINSTTNTYKSSGLTSVRLGQGSFRFTFDTGRNPPNIYYHVTVALSLDGTSSLSCPLMSSIDQRTTTYFNVRLLTQAGYDTDILPNNTNANGDGCISIVVTFIP